MFKNFKAKIYFVKNLSRLFKVLRSKFKEDKSLNFSKVLKI
jgi:hypothetical protein